MHMPHDMQRCGFVERLGVGESRLNLRVESALVDRPIGTGDAADFPCTSRASSDRLRSPAAPGASPVRGRAAWHRSPRQRTGPGLSQSTPAQAPHRLRPRKDPGIGVRPHSSIATQPAPSRRCGIGPKSGSWLMAAITAVAGMSNSDPGSGTGRGRPDPSGSPSVIRMQRTPAAAPSRRRNSIGAASSSTANALFECPVDLRADGRHFRPGPAVEDGDLRAEPLADPRSVDRGVSAADDDHSIADRHRVDRCSPG